MRLNNIAAATDAILKHAGHDIRLATPLGLGKPNDLLNSVYEKAAANPSLQLKIYTALSLGPPQPSSELAKRFFAPFSKKQWGENYPVLEYFKSGVRDQLPPNIEVHEFYFQAAAALKSRMLQRHYQSVNYTHAAESIFKAGINVIVQLVAVRNEGGENGKKRYSLSCNPDLTFDLIDMYGEKRKDVFVVGVVHPQLPFLDGEPEVSADFFDVLVEGDSESATHAGQLSISNYELFALPRMPVSPEDHFIGFYASQLMQDGGTIQIGIGSLSDAIVAALRLRQENNAAYVRMAQKLHNFVSYTDTFKEGLYGLTEMLTDGFMHLRRSQILKREVTDERTGAKTYVHGAFFLGSKEFYKWLRELSPQDRPGLRMSRVSKVNDLYDPNEVLLRRQRRKTCFFNTTMQVSLLGEAASETLPNAQVVSGVGGQYNFVAMALELKDARSVLMLRSARFNNSGERVSNIQFSLEHLTIPRHLRDVVVTEYGVAFLRGKTDEECIIEMIQVADSQFQAQLIARAQKAGKLRDDFKLAKRYQNNTPVAIAKLMESADFKINFTPFPFGSDFSPEEERIVLALQKLQEDMKISKLKLVKALLAPVPLVSAATGADDNSRRTAAQEFSAELKRMKLDQPRGIKERVYRKLLLRYIAIVST